MEFPQRFGKYTLLKRLATGGMAEIFLAYQSGMNGFEKEVAVKRLLPEHAENDELVSMFLDEARIAANLTHPNIAQIYDLGRIDDDYFIAMEYVRGVDLRRLCSHGIAVGNYLPLNHAVRIVAEVCDALEYAHTRTTPDGHPMGIVHRDISPTNILVTYDGAVKLVDFGIAKAANKATVTKSGQIKGKFGYMAPEQTRGEAVDARTDLFAVGINLYEVTVGRRLFRGTTEMETIQAIEACNFPTPRQVDARFPEGLERVIMRSLARDAVDRYPSARQMQMALEEFLATAGLRSTAGMLAGYMRHIFRDQLALEVDESARLRAMVRTLPPAEPAVRRSPFREANTEISGPPMGAFNAPLRDAATVEQDDDTAVMSASAAGAALSQWGGAPVTTPNHHLADETVTVPERRAPSPPVASTPYMSPAQTMPQAASPAPAIPQVPSAAPAHAWGALNALPPAQPVRPAPPRPQPTWAPPTTPAQPVDDSDLKIRKPRSYTGLLMLLLVCAGGAGLWYVMQHDLKKAPAQTSTNKVFQQPRLTDVMKRADVPPPAPPKKTLLRLESEPPGARVVVNGNVLNQLTPTAVQSFQGRSATVRMLLPGYRPAEKRLTLTGDDQPVKLVLEKGKPVVGALHVESAPSGAEVIINGREVGVTPVTLPKVAANTELSMRVVKAGFYPHHVSYTVKEGEQGDIGIRLVPDTGDRRMAVVNVETIPSGAVVTRLEPTGDKKMGRTSRYPVKINAAVDGHLHVRAEAPRFLPAEATIDVRAPFYTVYLRLPAPVLFNGTFSLIGARGVTVYVDNEELGKSPIRKRTLTEGEHTLVLFDEKSGKRLETTFVIERNAQLQRSVVRSDKGLSLN